MQRLGSPSRRDRLAEIKEQLITREIFETHHLLTMLPLITDVYDIINNLMINLYVREIDRELPKRLLASMEELLAGESCRIEIYDLWKIGPIVSTFYFGPVVLKRQNGILKLANIGDRNERDISESALREIANNYDYLQLLTSTIIV